MSSGDELVTLYSYDTLHRAGMRDTLLLMIPVREDTVLNPVYVYIITLSGNPVNRHNYLSGTA
jgi:hypothetical protein